MVKAFRRRVLALLITVTAGILIIALFFNGTTAKANIFSDVIGVVVTPLQKLFAVVGYNIQNTLGYFGNMDSLRQENAELRSEIAVLQNKTGDMDKYKSENDSLRQMLNLKQNDVTLDIESAEVISKSPDNWYSLFTIDKGTANGLQRQQAVITSDRALVGYITEVGTNWAKVVAIIDPRINVAVITAASRDIGVVSGGADLAKQALCKMTDIPSSANINQGDFIETSGSGGIYPKGLMVGQITEVRPETQSMSKYAIVQPAVDFGHITEVFVVKNGPAADSGGN